MTPRQDLPRDDESQAALDRYLQQLPGARPDAALGPQLIERHLSRRRRRRIAAPLAVAAGLLVWIALGRMPVDAPLPDEATSVTPAVDASLVEVRSLDRRLQAAYLADADPAELEALWRARERASAVVVVTADARIRL